MNPKVDIYLIDGCGRCPKGSTPECKVHVWQNELHLLREICLSCGLTEELKWGVPCYTYNKKNILLLSAFKNHCTLSFFKGALLSDSDKILEAASEESQSIRIIRFTKPEAIIKLEPFIKSYIFEAIEIERIGLKVQFKSRKRAIPEELIDKFKELPILKKAFENLTPGRQKSYIIYFSQAKQSKTRTARIEKHIKHILNSKGLSDIYKDKYTKS